MKDESYFIRDSEAERARLLEQDEVMTSFLPLLPPYAAQLVKGTVLDLACGPGGWGLEVATQYSSATVIGVDNNEAMIECAREQARDQQVPNALFEHMDITGSFDRWSPASFAGINGRFLGSFLLREQWQALIHSCFCFTRIGGWIRFSEYDAWSLPDSPCLDELNQRTAQALWKAGKNFSEHTYYYGPKLSALLSLEGYGHVQSNTIPIDFSRGQPFYEGMKMSLLMAAQLLRGFWERTGVMRPDEFQRLFSGARQELEREDFQGTINVFTVCGTRAGSWEENPIS